MSTLKHSLEELVIHDDDNKNNDNEDNDNDETMVLTGKEESPLSPHGHRSGKVSRKSRHDLFARAA